MNKIVDNILHDLEVVEEQLPDDKWDEHHWKGVKTGLIRAISIITKKYLNYNLTAKEIKEMLINKER